MFGSRKSRAPHPPPNVSAASPSATTAALTAFRHDSTASTSSLSAAAAAAALRARPSTPTNVAAVQTKRTVRRSASIASNNSNFIATSTSTNDLHYRPGHLRRQSSSGSMTERTFRSPSPGPRHQRSQSSGGTPRTPYSMDDAPPPPVPAIPESVNMAAARARGARPKSLGFVNPPVKTASQKMSEKEKGGSWFGAAKVGDMSNVRTSDAIMRTTSTKTKPSARPAPESPQQEDGRPESRGSSSINFSYPARIRVASPSREIIEEEGTQRPTASPTAAPKPKKRSSTLSPQRGGSVRSARPASIASDRELVYDPNSRRMVPRADLESFEPIGQTSAERRPKKKKGHLAKGTMGRARGSTVDNAVSNEAQMAAVASLKSRRPEERQPVIEEQEEYYEEEPQTEPALESERQRAERQVEPQAHIRQPVISMSLASNAPEVISQPLSDQDESGLQKKPSTVREESEQSQFEAAREAPNNAAAALDAVPVRHNVYTHGVPSPPQSENTDDLAPAELAATSRTSPEPILEKPEPRETKNIRRESRTHSNSPVRSAHFGPVSETLTVKHEPPVRSLSPRKSALKRSPSRDTSPIGDRSDVSGLDTPTQERPPPRKKSVRVSFDDENTVVVGEAAGLVEPDSPVPPSPRKAIAGGRKLWYNPLGIGRRKGPVPLEEDEVMKPRPALPSFGSVRGRKTSPTSTEGRALVRPHDPLEEVSESPSPEFQRRKLASSDISQPSDHALGGLIKEKGSRSGANISKQREPLPPVVTSMEGNGFGSDSSSSDDEAALVTDMPKLPAEGSMASQASTLVSRNDGFAVEQAASEDEGFGAEHPTVPSFLLTQPSPQPQKQEKERDSYLRFPGGFPETASESEDDSATPPTRQVTFEHPSQTEDGRATAHTTTTALATQSHATEELEQDTDEESVFSDAYEDLSHVDGDAFQSLDAVVDSPIATTPPRRVLEKAHAQRSELTSQTPQSHRTGESSVPSEPVDQWAAAKVYWRSLTADKRAQLEKEAADEAGTEGDLEDMQQLEDKPPRRKKSVEKRTAEKRAIEQQRTEDPSRTYMIQPGTKAGSINSDASPKRKSFTPWEPEKQQLSGKSVGAGTRLRKTVRSPAAPQPAESGTHLRKSMRASTGSQLGESVAHMRQSMRPSPNESPAPRQRPVSHQPVSNKPETTSALNKNRHTRTMSAVIPTPASPIQPSALRRRGSDSSASSFRRARPVTTTGGFGFRKTMRGSIGGGSVDLPEDTCARSQQQLRDTSSRFSLRATSPPVAMRTSLRSDQRRRSEDSGKGYLRFPGLSGKSSEKKAGKMKATSSRFGDDSSDEEPVSTRRTFTSRFVDSSDDDVTPAKPLPSLSARTMRIGRNKSPPSPPLPEEEDMSDAEPPVVAVAAGDEKAPGVTSARSGRGMDASSEKRQRRGSFMSTVLRRNKKNDGGAKITRPDLEDNVARRDTTLERSAEELGGLRSGGSNTKLQKRVASPPAIMTTISSASQPQKDWPLTPTAGANADDDKDVFFDAADGTDGGSGDPASPSQQKSASMLGHSKSQSNMVMTRPGFLTRRSTHVPAGAATLDHSSVAEDRGKKKKFSSLRRIFRLDE